MLIVAESTLVVAAIVTRLVVTIHRFIYMTVANFADIGFRIVPMIHMLVMLTLCAAHLTNTAAFNFAGFGQAIPETNPVATNITRVTIGQIVFNIAGIANQLAIQCTQTVIKATPVTALELFGGFVSPMMVVIDRMMGITMTVIRLVTVRVVA